MYIVKIKGASTMIIDAHYHIEEKIEKIERLLNQMDYHNIDKIALISPLCDPFRVDGIAESLAKFARKTLSWKWKKIGIITYKSLVTGKGQFSILGKKYNIYPVPDNDFVQKAMNAYPDRFLGWIFINPAASDPIKEIEKYISKPGWIGVKCHLFWHQYSTKLLDGAAALCNEKKKAMILHHGVDDGQGDYKYLPERYPDLNIIYAHASVPFFYSSWEYIKEKPNVYVDLSGPYLDEKTRNRAVEILGPGKCIYGTDGPYGYEDSEGNYDRSVVLEEIYRLPVSDPEKEKILSGNFLKITGLK